MEAATEAIARVDLAGWDASVLLRDECDVLQLCSALKPDDDLLGILAIPCALPAPVEDGLERLKHLQALLCELVDSAIFGL